jgi:hypothetical protein
VNRGCPATQFLCSAKDFDQGAPGSGRAPAKVPERSEAWNASGLPRVCDGSEIFLRIVMHSPHLIERAFQLAPGVHSVEEIRKALRHEGYSNIDAHLAGASIRADLKKRLAR